MENEIDGLRTKGFQNCPNEGFIYLPGYLQVDINRKIKNLTGKSDESKAMNHSILKNLTN